MKGYTSASGEIISEATILPWQTETFLSSMRLMSTQSRVLKLSPLRLAWQRKIDKVDTKVEKTQSSAFGFSHKDSV